VVVKLSWARLSFVLLALMVATAFASSPPSQPCFFIPRHTTFAGAGAGGAGFDLSDAPFVTWDFNASLNNETPVWALTRSVVPSPADNASLYVGNSSLWWLGGYFSNLYTGNLCLSGDCRVAWPSFAGEVYNGTFNETEGVYVYNGTDWRVDFNETKLNQTIDSRLNSTTYYPAAYNVIAGTVTGGNLASLFYYDGDTLNVSEAVGANPLIVVVNFTDVTSFDWLLIRERYQGGSGHEIYVQIWNFDSSAWDSYYIFADQAALVELPPLYIADASEHINATNVSMRFFHLQSGNPSHVLYIDFVQLVDGFSTTTTITHDSLSSRNLDENHLQYLNRNATRKLLKDWNVGFFAIYNISTLNATTASFFGNVSVKQTNTQLQPQLNILQLGAGDAAAFFGVGADNVSMGLDNSDNDNFEISNASTLTGTTYSDENTLLRLHTEAGSEGIIDFNHQSRARAYILEEPWAINGLTWEQVNFTGETWDEKNEYDNATLFRFTALEEGYYAVDVQLWVEAVWNWEAQLRRNDASVVWTHMAFYTAGDLPEAESIIHIHDTVFLSAAQYLEVWVYNDNPGGIAFITPGEDKSYFTVHKVS